MIVKSRWDNSEIGKFEISPHADLKYADLRNADLKYANLSDADLKYADLRNADLSDADLRNANLKYANLKYADLRNADLSDADLRNADLRNTDLRNADLRNADLRNADLRNADLRNAKNVPNIVCAKTCILPEGKIIGWKKAKEGLVKLEIPQNAKRSNATGRKCRAEFAVDIAHYDFEDNEVSDDFTSRYDDKSYTYKIGETLYPDSFDENRWNECSNGIHFFITKEEALAY